MNDIVISGINLMLTGMITVFIFLATLILIINIVASLFENDITKGSINIDVPKTQNHIEEHKKIIKLIQREYSMNNKKIGITELVLRDAHQSLLATRLRYEDMESILTEIDNIGYWSVESWGRAIFDSCIRYLGEDPWERIRKIKSKMPNTPQQMLLRGQNLLGYKHYSDEIVYKFVEKSIKNGVDVFRIF